MNINEQVHEQTDPLKAEALAAAKLVNFWAYAGLPVPEEYPVETQQVLQLSQRLGYRVDADFVEGLIAHKRLFPLLVDGRRLWHAVDIWTLHAECNARRRWLLHPLHVADMSAVELRQLEAENAGVEHCFNDLDHFDTEQLLMMMEQIDLAPIRHVLRVALTSRLRSLGAL